MNLATFHVVVHASVVSFLKTKNLNDGIGKTNVLFSFSPVIPIMDLGIHKGCVLISGGEFAPILGTVSCSVLNSEGGW